MRNYEVYQENAGFSSFAVTLEDMNGGNQAQQASH